jgi:hypothetical protein
MTALFALHGVGEFHADVSGVERRVKPSRCNYVLSAQYFRTLSRLPFAADGAVQPVARSQQNKHVAQLPFVVDSPIQVMGMAGTNKVRRTAACPLSEFKLLLGGSTPSSSSDEPLLAKHVARFCDKDFGQQIWENAFTAALQHIFDSECTGDTLLEMPTAEELARKRWSIDYWWLPSQLASALASSK